MVLGNPVYDDCGVCRPWNPKDVGGYLSSFETSPG
jgi:hypothetical protein